MGTYIVTGLMSGTSLDGVDLACCRFIGNHPEWQYEILEAVTIPYAEEWQKKMAGAGVLAGEDLYRLHTEYGQYLGELVSSFHQKRNLSPDLVVSHGHTVFHQPDSGYTLQIGHGGYLTSRAGVPVINDLRSQDVALGGQGAPLVPAGDHYLFSEYELCLNLGGFSNISFLSRDDRRMAMDICPVNIVLNSLSRKKEKEYDKGGEMARSGQKDEHLLSALNDLPYYSLEPPKSLGREWVESQILPMIAASHLSTEDLLSTFTEHAAIQISLALNQIIRSDSKGKVLVTGGGAHNSYLIERLRDLSAPEICIPEKMLVDFKEAMVFAFLGLLRWQGIPNIFASVTGASKDSCSGALFLP